MKRREFIDSAAQALAGLALTAAPLTAAQKKSIVMTVRGPIDAGGLGLTLMHEHVLVDFIGADQVSRERYDQDEAFAVALPHMRRVAELGCRTFVDCTPAYIGRDAQLLGRLAAATGLNIVTTTGYYGAAKDKYVPAFAYRESAAVLAARWIREFERGIEGTLIRPGLIKIGVDAGPLSEIDAKLVRAAALTHLKTGLTIGSHTGDGTAAMQQLDLLTSLGVSPSAFIWIHAQNEKDKALHARAAERGCFVEFDGISGSRIAEHVEMVAHMAGQGQLQRTLVSMDAGWYHVGEPRGGNYRSYESLFLEFLPALKSRLDERQIEQLLVHNPQSALVVRVRKHGS